MHATSVPPLLVSRLDCERLESLLEQPLAKGLNTEPLRRELDRAELLEPKEMPDDVITMNSTARFRDVNSGAERELTLVYPKDADGSPEKVSILAPVGSALLGLHVGESRTPLRLPQRQCSRPAGRAHCASGFFLDRYDAPAARTVAV